MTVPRIHDVLKEFFGAKDPSGLNGLIQHPHYRLLQQLHGLDIPSDLFFRAFTHASFKHEFKVDDQEVLEFLGDAVLELIITQKLVEKFPQEKEGVLSKLRSALVNEVTLAKLGKQLELSSFIVVGKGEFQKKTFELDVVLSDTFEALLGAIYQSQGLLKVSEFFFKELSLLDPSALSLDFINNFDAKSKLQEYTLKKFKKLPQYVAKEVDGKFLVELWINEQLQLSGIFSSKKEGEKNLAQNFINNGIN
jgi:ribonuclease-3